MGLSGHLLVHLFLGPPLSREPPGLSVTCKSLKPPFKPRTFRGIADYTQPQSPFTVSRMASNENEDVLREMPVLCQFFSMNVVLLVARLESH